MTRLISTGLRLEGNHLLILDQQLLPGNEIWVDCKTPHQMAALIQALKIRGAPLLGVAAALSLARYAADGGKWEDVLEGASILRRARPTAVNLAAAVNRVLENPSHIAERAEEIFEEDVKLCEAIAKNGISQIEDGDNILTHCNTGGLATAGIGTALGVIRRAFEEGKKIHVYVDETRPLLQGARLTAWELQRLRIPYTLITDSMAATLMKEKKIQKVLVGADRIATNGDFANKIGTYNLAVISHYHEVPFFVAAPHTTIDPHCHSGEKIPIEERNSEEVRGAEGYFGKIRWSPENCPVFNPSFDVTSGSLVSGYILDTGYFEYRDVTKGALAKF